jgi:hypothetical protein
MIRLPRRAERRFSRVTGKVLASGFRRPTVRSGDLPDLSRTESVERGARAKVVVVVAPAAGPVIPQAGRGVVVRQD